ncbi:uncharacterized protein BDR25DRAFT_304336 [Lindgomyces ingoldianus]|uniref:Uncharacterized protein n=1 Tax=Lindgomyces ingoldianus TaxID=673940 RepID=A0ACB6QRR3_9PLEO|nr:uncharacterized protein BDR25DRAFT_304336 [Lindgomyces ingoldianus]KAF2469586.1 hypothetical protein BDR25DRAFT_304336 [Lindgomyces ingoldianus]
MAIFKTALSDPVFLRGGNGSTGNSSSSNVRANVASLHRAGIPILSGKHDRHTQRERQHLVDAGPTPAEAINAAISVAAKYHRLTDRGVIAPG